MYAENFIDTQLYLRGDSGFATPELYELAEEYGCKYVIRLKSNNLLYKNATFLEKELDEITKDNLLDYACVYGEFLYQASSWKHPRRVVCKIEKPTNQMDYMYTFIVTNIELPPQEIVRIYCNRGRMENFIKECKNGFDFSAVSSSSQIVNENRLQLHALAYNIFNWFRRLVLPDKMKKLQIDTIRIKLLKIASKVVKSSRYITFKLSSSCPYKKEFFETIENIDNLVQLE
jgi:hypothetical protein